MFNKAFCLFALCALIIACSTQHVVTDHAFQKRKYRPGLFVSKKSKSLEHDLHKHTADENTKGPIENEQVGDLEGESVQTQNTNPSLLEQAPLSDESTLATKQLDPLEKTNKLIAKFIPMQYAEGFTKRIGKLAAVDTNDSGTSMAAIIGCALGGAGIGSFLAGVMSFEIGIGIYLLILAFALGVTGLVFSIKGAVESGRKDIKGTILSIIGMVTNGIIVVMGLIVALLALMVLLIYAGCN